MATKVKRPDGTVLVSGLTLARAQIVADTEARMDAGQGVGEYLVLEKGKVVYRAEVSEPASPASAKAKAAPKAKVAPVLDGAEVAYYLSYAPRIWRTMPDGVVESRAWDGGPWKREAGEPKTRCPVPVPKGEPASVAAG